MGLYRCACMLNVLVCEALMVEMIRHSAFLFWFKHSNKKVHAIYTRVDYDKDVELSRNNH
ncbi:hypothetical protein CFP56_010951 [Quercus suber]|uniref:Uncharacterized protein n=1 Tax=Quercus suber TaxID=58331 RepID=A0AAW0KZP3_QUESU